VVVPDEQAVAVRESGKSRPRPVIPCGRCNGNRRAVVFDNGLLLCGECFLRLSMRRTAEAKTGGAGTDVRASRWQRN